MFSIPAARLSFTGGVSVFPNPVTEDIISVRYAEGAETVELMDLTGRVLFAAQATNNSMDINTSSLGLESGMYFVRVYTDGAAATTSIIVE